MEQGRYLVFKCRNRKVVHGREIECPQKIGGPEIHSLYRHCFSEGPYESIHFCPKCGWIKLSVTSLLEPPRTEIIGKGKGVRIDMVNPDELFAYTETVVS